ncbi:MAG: hypothetical protein JSW61_11860 [Candidatus Thorarchaeota archaeon]|nr:MAG: hypothetical protein JSW61_11860 [Candidatus Thorarchaeota archaeon]
MKLVDLSRELIRVLKETYPAGKRSDVIAKDLGVPKRRVYDVIAVLKSLDMVRTSRRYDGTTVTWIDRSEDFVSRADYDAIRMNLDEVNVARKDLQVQVAELKESLRVTKTKLRTDVPTVEASDRMVFHTTQLRIRPLSSNGIKRVRDSGMEVLVETNEAGMLVDPAETESDEKESLIKSLQRV